MDDLFPTVTLEAFLREESRNLTSTGNKAASLAALAVSRLMSQFQAAVVDIGVIGGCEASEVNRQVAQAAGVSTMVRAYAFLAITAALTMREMAQREGAAADSLPEIDMLASWYASRWRKTT